MTYGKPAISASRWAAAGSTATGAREMHRGEEMSRIPLADKALLLARRVDHEFDRGTFRLDHDSISREHAAIVHAFQGESFVIDLGSRYGTFVDGQKIEPHNMYLSRRAHKYDLVSQHDATCSRANCGGRPQRCKSLSWAPTLHP